MSKSEQARADHECARCGGTGDQPQRKPFIPDSDEGLYFWRCGTCDSQNSRTDGECQFCECAGLDCTRASCSDPRHFVPCPVCLGSGRISDRMPVADALADAETLRLVDEDFGTLRLVSGDGGWRKQRLGVTAAMLTGYRALAIDWMCGAEHLARREARAAFRAVPGLRGER